MKKHYEVLIIGAGGAGMSAALSCFDNGTKDILLLERNLEFGGILGQCIHNGFGLTTFNKELTGPEFSYMFSKEVISRGIEVLFATNVLEINEKKEVTFINKDGFFKVSYDALILASGCYERNAGAIGLPGTRPAGVLTAGQAQLYLNKFGYLVGKKVFILGSGDIGLIMARRMSLEGAKVLGVAELMSYSNGLQRNIVQCLEDFNIPLYLSHTVTNVIGKDKLEAIEISKVDENLKPIEGSSKRIECDTLLLSVGLLPEIFLLKEAGAKVNSKNQLEVDDSLMTSLPGIFVCGNALHVHDLIDDVVLEGKQAGLSASRFVKEGIKNPSYIKTRNGENVSYVVPSLVDQNSLEPYFEIKFRVKKPLRNVEIVYSCNDTIFKRTFKPFLLPSQMVIEKIKRELIVSFKGEIAVSVIDKE